jgi:hypothetical protein
VNKPKHTPGQYWNVEYNGDGVQVEFTNRLVFDTTKDNPESLKDVAELEANARLIAAAPELFEALEWVLGHVNRCAAKDSSTDEYGLGKIKVPYGVGTIVDAHLIFEKIKSALAKATGGSNE